MPYELLIETDGGPDHAISTLKNKLAIFAMFLVTRVYKLIVIRGCPGLSYLNTVERTMSVLNIGLANLALHMKPYQWLLDEFLVNIFLMKQVQIAVSEYDNELPTAIDLFQPKTDLFSTHALI